MIWAKQFFFCLFASSLFLSYAIRSPSSYFLIIPLIARLILCMLVHMWVESWHLWYHYDGNQWLDILIRSASIPFSVNRTISPLVSSWIWGHEPLDQKQLVHLPFRVIMTCLIYGHLIFHSYDTNIHFSFPSSPTAQISDNWLYIYT